MSYIEFVTNVIGLQPDALRETPGSKIPATPEILNKFQESLKEKLVGSKACRDKVFTIFDKDGGGSISIAEFRRGVHEMGLPVNKKQVEQLFRQFDTGQTGTLDMLTFTRDLMGMSSMKASTPKAMPTSRGGAPQMPKEFRTPSSRPKTSAENQSVFDLRLSTQRSHSAMGDLPRGHTSSGPGMKHANASPLQPSPLISPNKL